MGRNKKSSAEATRQGVKMYNQLLRQTTNAARESECKKKAAIGVRQNNAAAQLRVIRKNENKK
jgi:hypothetical protein